MVFDPNVNANQEIVDDEKTLLEQAKIELRKTEYDNTVYYCKTLSNKKDQERKIGTYFSTKKGNNPAFFINFEPKMMKSMKEKVTSYLIQEDERYIILQDLLVTFNEKVTDYNNQSVVIYINENDHIKMYELKRGLIETLLKETSINASYETIILRRDLFAEMDKEETNMIEAMNQ